MTPSSPYDGLTHELYSRHFFRMADNNFMRCRALARVVAAEMPEVKSWSGVISDISVGHESWKQFSSGLAEATSGVKLIDPAAAKFGSTDFKPQIFRVLQSGAEGVFNLTYGADMVTLWTQAKTLGLADKMKVMADASGELDLSLIVGKDLPPLVWSNVHWYYGNPNGDEVNAHLVEEIRKRTQAEHPSSLIGPAHSSVLAYAKAIETAGGTDAMPVIEALESVKVATCKGEIRFRKEDHQQIGMVNLIATKPTADGFEIVAHREVPGAEIADAPTPGKPLEM